jgi:hypothetical protein
MNTTFSWTSALGISSITFTIIAVIYLLIGTAGLVITMKYGSGNFSGGHFLGSTVDQMIFGKPIREVNTEYPHFEKYISMLMIVFCSFMIMTGILQFAIAHYSLPTGAAWALWASVIANIVMLAIYWFVIIIPIINAYGVSYFSMWHPYAFIPTVLLPMGIISGLIGLKN